MPTLQCHSWGLYAMCDNIREAIDAEMEGK